MLIHKMPFYGIVIIIMPSKHLFINSIFYDIMALAALTRKKDLFPSDRKGGTEREEYFMKKTLAMLMACAMTAASLAGCSTANTTQTTAAPETTAQETSTAETTAEETTAAETTAEETSAEGSADEAALHIGSLKGPTTMGLVSLMDKASKGESEGSYDFTMVTDASELAAQMVSGDLDIALVPANMASILYQKTKQGVEVIDINTLGVLYVVAADDSIQSIADLKGKTLYMTGKGTTPDYVLQYLLGANGMTSDDLTIEYKSEATEVAAVLKENADAIGLLPQPFVTAAMAQNENLKMVLNLTEEWDKTQPENGSALVTGVTVCRKEVIENQADAVDTFLKEHEESAAFANANVEETAQLVADAGIIEKAPVAAKAIPYCNITYIDGADMQTKVSGYLSVLFDLDPTSIGGQLPDEGFYYIHE